MLGRTAIVADWLCGRVHDRVGSHPLSPAAPPSVPMFHTAKAQAVIKSLQNQHHQGKDLLSPSYFTNRFFAQVEDMTHRLSLLQL